MVDEGMSEILKPKVSEAARALVAEKCTHMPPSAAEELSGWFTLIDECDERWQRRWYPEPSDSTAIQAARGWNYMNPAQQERERREYLDEREIFVNGAADLMALYPQPLVIKLPL